MKRRLLCLVLALLSLSALLPAGAVGEAQDFEDVPEGWAKADIYAARESGLMDGVAPGRFGYGSEILRRDFVIILSRMLGWTVSPTGTASFTDTAGGYYTDYVEAAVAQGAVDAGGVFEPDRPITRGEMAVMLVRALGYQRLAGQVAGYGHGFSDVPETLGGYITIAVDIGMTTGLTATTFGPDDTAKREQAAAMMMRVYRRMTAATDWLHGFYAFSSYDQRGLIADMDAVSLGWARMSMSAEGPWLNTGRAGDNEWNIPTAYESITEYLRELQKPAHLDVYMDMTQRLTLADGAETPALRALLGDPASRERATALIVAEATRAYPAIGHSPYSGVTIDFEGLRAWDKDGFSAFITLLAGQLHGLGLALYVTVQPAVFEGEYYDGFDFRAIGEAADKVILMAHDYQPTSLSGLVGSTWQLRTPLTPIAQVYYALRAVTHGETGVRDVGKVALAISFSTIGWELDEQGRVASPTRVNPATSTLAGRMAQSDAVKGWSEEYCNPYITYSTGGRSYHVWYEDSRSVQDKITLARLFGITGVSVWRIGTIPDTAGYDVWSALKAR